MKTLLRLQIETDLARLDQRVQAFTLASISSGKREQSGPVVLKSAETFAKHIEGTYPQEFKNLSLGKILRGYITGEWAGAELDRRRWRALPQARAAF